MLRQTSINWLPMSHHAPVAPGAISPHMLHAYSVFRRPLQHQRVRCHAASGSAGNAGKCYIVGAGPGPADLLTIRAAELLRQAEVVIFDDLGAQAAVEAYAPPAAERVYVGKRGNRPSIKQPQIDEIVVQHAAAGKKVVRLKGGCPSVFSRVHSEQAALQAAGIEYEVVPGVSSALAAPLSAGFPLTHPQHSKAFAVTSAHDPGCMDWQALVAIDTLVLLMGGSNLPQVVQQLQQHGRGAATPVAVVREAALPTQRTFRGTLGNIEERTAGESLSPCIIIVGDIAAEA